MTSIMIPTAAVLRNTAISLVLLKTISSRMTQGDVRLTIPGKEE